MRYFSSRSTPVSAVACTAIVSSPTSTVTSGLARRFQYQSGLRSDPAFEATTRYLSPSARYITGWSASARCGCRRCGAATWRTGEVAADSPVVGAELGDRVLVELLSRASQRPSSRLPGGRVA